MPIIGIDLGTTYSALAVVEGGSPNIIENAQGARTTPSVVAYLDDGKVLVGDRARNQAITNTRNTIYASKRLIGRRYDDESIRDFSFPFEVIKAPNGDAWVKAGGKERAPQQVAASVLSELKKAAEDYLGVEVTEAVITVPAYFNDSQRQATKDAGKIAGLDVKRIINEPTAAALAYGLDKKKGDQKIVVFDLGGGTFDVSIIEASQVDGEYQFEVLSTSGDTSLGGEDFDQAIMQYIMNNFEKQQGIDLSQDPLAVQRIKEAAEKAKRELSTAQEADINLPFITADASGPKHLNIKLGRAKLESLLSHLIERTVTPCKTALKDSGLKDSEIDEVILVGGSTRMPKVQEKAAEIFGKKPRRDVNPDEAVALGAAIQAGVLSGAVKDVLLLDVTPLSLGIETLGSVMTRLIDKNTTIPTEATQVFSTAQDHQTSVSIHVLQGDRPRASDNKSLGRFDLTDISRAPRGVPQIEVSFKIDANGILNVSAKDKATGKEQSIIIKASSGLSDEDIQAMLRDAEKNAETDKKFQQLVKVRNEADAIIHTVEQALVELGDKVGTEKQSIQEAIDQLKETLKSEDQAAIERDTQQLQTISSAMLQQSYAEKQQKDGGAQQEETGSPSADDSSEAKKKDDDDVIDAEFEEVKD